MITKQRTLFYFVGDEAFKSLEEAQKCDLKKLVPLNPFATPEAGPQAQENAVADWLLQNADAIVDILTTTPRSRARGRKLHGAKRLRKVAVRATPPPDHQEKRATPE